MEGMYTMRKLTLTNHAQSNTTVLENEFIDNYMAKANGEYVKVYLLQDRRSSGDHGKGCGPGSELLEEAGSFRIRVRS